MTLLILGLIVFFSIHLLPSFTELRSNCIEKLGLLPYKGVFALISLLGFSLIVVGKGQAIFFEIWQPPAFLAMITKLLMLPAMVLLVAAYVPSNIKNKIRHPMMTGVKLWALAHLLSNGDLASILLFGTFLCFGVISVISANRRAAAAPPVVRPTYMDVLVLVIGGAVYAGVGLYHQLLFGVPIM